MPPPTASTSRSSTPPRAPSAAALRFAARGPPVCDHEPMPSRRVEWAVAGLLAGWAAARLAGADRLRFAEAWAVPLLSFTPQVAGGSWAGAVLLRGAGPAATAAIAGAALTAAVGPRAGPSRQPPVGGPGAGVRRGRAPPPTPATAGAALTAAVGPRAVPSRQPPVAGPVLRVLTA